MSSTAKAENPQEMAESLKTTIEQEMRGIGQFFPYHPLHPSHLILSEGQSQVGLGVTIFTEIQAIVRAIDALSINSYGNEMNGIASAFLSTPNYEQLYPIALKRYIQQEILIRHPSTLLQVEQHIRQYLELFSDKERADKLFWLVVEMTDAMLESSGYSSPKKK